MASQQEKKDVARTYVAVDELAPNIILGYYALTLSETSHTVFPNPKKYPQRVPVVRLGRFATDKSVQGQGLGEHLLIDALKRVAAISQIAGTAAVVVDAKDAKAAGFYQKYGFLPSPANPLQLFMPTATLRAAIAQAEP